MRAKADSGPRRALYGQPCAADVALPLLAGDRRPNRQRRPSKDACIRPGGTQLGRRQGPIDHELEAIDGAAAVAVSDLFPRASARGGRQTARQGDGPEPGDGHDPGLAPREPVRAIERIHRRRQPARGRLPCPLAEDP
jgi:hypothetical protein